MGPEHAVRIVMRAAEQPLPVTPVQHSQRPHILHGRLHITHGFHVAHGFRIPYGRLHIAYGLRVLHGRLHIAYRLRGIRDLGVGLRLRLGGGLAVAGLSFALFGFSAGGFGRGVTGGASSAESTVVKRRAGRAGT